MNPDALARTLFPPDQVFEVRAPESPHGVLSGYFNDLDTLYQTVAEYDGKLPGWFITYNPINPALFNRAANRLARRPKKTTSDQDVLRRTRLVLDVDVNRPSGISSTDAEHEAALERARDVAHWLTACGWPDAILADSGNGAHLIYKIDEPNTPETTRTITAALEALAFKFNDKTVTIDTALANPAHLTKLYGTMVRKGDSTAVRPHRRSQILSGPDSFDVVPTAKLAELAAFRPADPELTFPMPTGTVFDVRAFCHRHGLAIAKEKPWQGGIVYELAACPFNPDHPASVIQMSSGAVGFKCFHNRCQAYRWADLKARLEPHHPFALPPERATIAPEITLTPASAVTPSSAMWAVKEKIPLRTVTAFAGDPGMGKSTIAFEFTARWSRGEAEGELHGAPVSIVIASVEDSPSTTIVPRLLAAGADLSKVHFFEVHRDGVTGGITLPDDLSVLSQRMQEVGARILVVDPLMAHLPAGVNSWRDQDIRRALAPLARLAEDFCAAVLVIAHLTKDQAREAIARVGGSIGIVGAARSVLLAARDPDDPEGPVRVLCPLKNNLAPLSPAVKYRIDGVTLPGPPPIRTSRIIWMGTAPDLMASELLAKREPEERGDRAEAKAWLIAYLADGSKPAEQVFHAAEKAGLSRATIKRAKKELHVCSAKNGFADSFWHWMPPPPPEGAHEGAQYLTADPLRETHDKKPCYDADLPEGAHVTEIETLRAGFDPLRGDGDGQTSAEHDPAQRVFWPTGEEPKEALIDDET